jgi:molybdopterin-synthase adenylyltransferase
MRRPRIKHAHLPVRYDDGRIRLGGVVRGIATEVHDPDGWVWELLRSLDGSRTVDQAVTDLAGEFPARSTDEIRRAVEDLVRAGYVEDVGAQAPDELSTTDRDRYGRGNALMSWMDLTPRPTGWDAQLRLLRARVVVVGLGGVGGAAALALATSGVGRLHCVDHDVVELSNLNRQLLFTERDLGRPKVEVATERLREYNSTVTVSGQRRAVDGQEALRELAEGSDVLLLAADRPQPIRRWANRACLAAGVAWVCGGYHGPQVSVGLYRPDGGPCHECARPGGQHRRARPLWETATRVHAANAVTANVTGLLAAHAVMSLITGVPALRTNCRYGFNLVTLQDGFAEGPRTARPDCPACGRAGLRARSAASTPPPHPPGGRRSPTGSSRPRQDNDQRG